MERRESGSCPGMGDYARFRAASSAVEQIVSHGRLRAPDVVRGARVPMASNRIPENDPRFTTR
jgi:hypothetical protein